MTRRTIRRPRWLRTARVTNRLLSRTDGQSDRPVTHNLVQALDASDRFQRDTRLGRIFHPGRISFREVKPRDSLHIVIDQDKVSAHVDEVCPLRCGPDGKITYSWLRVIGHNASSLVHDVGRRVRGVHGQQRCNLGCEMVWVDDDTVSELSADLHLDGSSDQGCCTEAPV